jgi:DNA-binding SARP family transcriptional activator
MVDIGGPKQRAVLALLALDAGRVVSVDRLVEGLWRDRPPEQASVSVRSYTSNLRRILDVPIENRRPGYVLVVDPSDVDVYRRTSTSHCRRKESVPPARTES